MPIPIAPIDGDVWSLLVEQIPECRDQRTVLVIDRTPAAEVVVVFSDFQHAFARNVPSAENILEKRDHVVRRFRPPKR